MRYCIFSVWDYKGGELYSRINLDYEEFILGLCEYFESSISNVDLSNISQEDLVEILNKNLEDENFFSYYASLDSNFCGNLYRINNGVLEKTYFEDHVDNIADYILKSWK